MRIQPIVPYYYVDPPMRRKQEQEEHVSFCSHLNRLMEIQRRHLMLQRLWAMMTGLFHPHREPVKLDRFV